MNVELLCCCLFFGYFILPSVVVADPHSAMFDFLIRICVQSGNAASIGQIYL